MYLIAIVVALCLIYGILLLFFPVFFSQPIAKLSGRNLFSLLILVILGIGIIALSLSIPDPELSNRVLHAFGGGFLAFIACFLAARDSKIVITRIQFFVLSFLIVLGLGIANEVLEFVLQNYAGFNFAQTVNDTWLDLISNTVGAVIAGVLLVNKKLNTKS